MFFWCGESALAQAEDRVQGTAKKFESRMQLRIYASWQEKKKIHVDTFLMRSKVLWVCWELHERLLWLVIKVRTFLGEKNGAFQAFIVQLYFNIAKKRNVDWKLWSSSNAAAFFSYRSLALLIHSNKPEIIVHVWVQWIEAHKADVFIAKLSAVGKKKEKARQKAKTLNQLRLVYCASGRNDNDTHNTVVPFLSASISLDPNRTKR